mmetsp:Transcript_24053/g.39061  ORF Transcript_24053/g.39061 Transcript_24053/m.39061 type:complete len:290 (-) Transcript_24053:764-1633(-)
MSRLRRQRHIHRSLSDFVEGPFHPLILLAPMLRGGLGRLLNVGGRKHLFGVRGQTQLEDSLESYWALSVELLQSWPLVVICPRERLGIVIGLNSHGSADGDLANVRELHHRVLIELNLRPDQILQRRRRPLVDHAERHGLCPVAHEYLRVKLRLGLAMVVPTPEEEGAHLIVHIQNGNQHQKRLFDGLPEFEPVLMRSHDVVRGGHGVHDHEVDPFDLLSNFLQCDIDLLSTQTEVLCVGFHGLAPPRQRHPALIWAGIHCVLLLLGTLIQRDDVGVALFFEVVLCWAR